MVDEFIIKMENSARINELEPYESIIKAGINEKSTVCDFGAGTGIFTFAAAKITSNSIYSLDKSEDMISLLINRKTKLNICNIEVLKVESDILPIEDKVCDFFIAAAVLHEINDIYKLFSEIYRILKPQSRILVIDFHKEVTPLLKPPIENRLSEEFIIEQFRKVGIRLIDRKRLGENYYSLVFEK